MQTASGSNPNGYTNGVMMVVGDGREGFKMRHISDNSVVRDVYLINDTNSSDKGKGKGKGGSGGKNGSNGSSGTSIDNNLDKANRLRITIMRLDKTRNVLICGTKSGMILLYRYPFLYTDSDSHCHAQCYAKYSIHDGT